MSERSFLITFDTNDRRLDTGLVKDHLKSDDTVTHWWNYLPGVFLVTATVGADEITDRLHEKTGDVCFLVAGVDLSQTQGWMPEKSWPWIKRRRRQAGRADAKHA